MLVSRPSNTKEKILNHVTLRETKRDYPSPDSTTC